LADGKVGGTASSRANRYVAGWTAERIKRANKQARRQRMKAAWDEENERLRQEKRGDGTRPDELRQKEEKRRESKKRDRFEWRVLGPQRERGRGRSDGSEASRVGGKSGRRESR